MPINNSMHLRIWQCFHCRESKRFTSKWKCLKHTVFSTSTIHRQQQQQQQRYCKEWIIWAYVINVQWRKINANRKQYNENNDRILSMWNRAIAINVLWNGNRFPTALNLYLLIKRTIDYTNFRQPIQLPCVIHGYSWEATMEPSSSCVQISEP